MISRFSKPLGDVSVETERITAGQRGHLDREREISRLLDIGIERRQCALCDSSLSGSETPIHRGVPYRFCAGCGHCQSSRVPPPEHRDALAKMNPFHSIYPDIASDAFQSRVERVYQPKLDWILGSAEGTGFSRAEMQGMKWMEFGCGAGYFLKALADAGIRRFSGLDLDLPLVAAANRILGGTPVSHFQGDLADAIRNAEADVLAAFFVLEHAENLPGIARALRQKPKGTIFAFSVPVFGLGAMLESGFDHFFARNLDSGVHTQLFTDRSIARLLSEAGYETASQWVFGQDASDFIRMLMARLENVYPPGLLNSSRKRLLGIQDELQGVIDRSFLADSRHILAVRK